MEERAEVMRQILVQLHERAVSATEALEVAQELIEKLQAENTRLGKENWILEGKLKRSDRLVEKLVRFEIPKLEKEVGRLALVELDNERLVKQLRILDYLRDADVMMAQMEMEAEEKRNA